MPRRGFPPQGEPQPPPNNNCGCVLWWCVLWQGGKRASAEGCAASAAAGCESSSPAASAAAVPKARPQGGIGASKSTRREKPLPRRAAKVAALPKAGRSEAEGGASSQNKLIVIKPLKENSPSGALFIIIWINSVKVESISSRKSSSYP